MDGRAHWRLNQKIINYLEKTALPKKKTLKRTGKKDTVKTLGRRAEFKFSSYKDENE